MPVSIFGGIPVTFLSSSNRTTSSNSGNLKDTTTNFAAAEAVTLLLDVTQLSAVAAGALDVYVDTSIDGGTTWFTAYKFAQVTTSTATRRLDIRSTGVGITEVGAENSVISTITAALATNTVLTRDVRLRWSITGTAGTALNASFAVYGIFQPMGTRGI